MSQLPSTLGRAGAALCVAILVGGLLAGCAPKKAATPPPPSPSGPVPFAKSAALATNLSALDGVGGSVQGTITVGKDDRPLSGTVSISGKSSQIMLVEGGTTPDILDEIVVDGERFTSRDDKTWIARGAKTAGTDLKSLLAGADTVLDSGVRKVGDVSAHEVLTSPDKIDVAPALGIDTWTFDEETTTLHIWADDSGKPLGFGASMSWKATIGGVSQPVTADVDVMFATTPPAEIKAPANPWQWIEDKPTGIALGIPAGWKPTDVNKSLGLTTYYDSASGTTVAYISLGAAGTASLTEATEAIAAKLDDTPSARQSAVIGSEDALWMTVHRTKQKDYEVVAIVLHETLAYEILVLGGPADEKAVDAQAVQIFSAVEFTR